MESSNEDQNPGDLVVGMMTMEGETETKTQSPYLKLLSTRRYDWMSKEYVRYNFWLVGGTSKICYFTPKFGEDEPMLTSIFFKGVGSTTN